MQLDLLRKNAELIQNGRQSTDRLSNELRLFPSMTFNCSGHITGLLLGADIRWSPSIKNRYPEVQIWRNVFASDQFIRQASQEIRLNPGGDFSPDGVLQYTLAPPISFQSGDVLGVYQPPEHESVVRLYYAGSNNASDSYRFFTGTNSLTTVALQHTTRKSSQLLLLSSITGKKRCPINTSILDCVCYRCRTLC